MRGRVLFSTGCRVLHGVDAAWDPGTLLEAELYHDGGAVLRACAPAEGERALDAPTLARWLDDGTLYTAGDLHVPQPVFLALRGPAEAPFLGLFAAVVPNGHAAVRAVPIVGVRKDGRLRPLPPCFRLAPDAVIQSFDDAEPAPRLQ